MEAIFGVNTPSIDELRLGIYEIIIDLLHEQYPSRKETNPKLQAVDQLEGMDKIRALFVDYVKNTLPASIERYKIAQQVMLERRKLGLPCICPVGTNIYLTSAGTSPGDFSHLDLSFLNVEMDEQSVPNIKGLSLTNCNLDGSTFAGRSLLYGVDLSYSSMKGADLSKVNLDDTTIINGANIEGAFFGLDWVPDRRALNYSYCAKTPKELQDYRANMSHESSVLSRLCQIM